MGNVSKEAILSKTHYGIGIYAHILSLYYPDQTVLSLSGRICSLTKNPFNADKPTLNIFIEKENVLGNAWDKEFARHSDSENAITAGDAFDFAELHYKHSGDELLQIINKKLLFLLVLLLFVKRLDNEWHFLYRKVQTMLKAILLLGFVVGIVRCFL